VGNNLITVVYERLQVARQQDVTGRRQAVTRPANRVGELGGRLISEIRTVVDLGSLPLCFDEDALLGIADARRRHVPMIGALQHLDQGVEVMEIKVRFSQGIHLVLDECIMVDHPVKVKVILAVLRVM
jgi:hypothetical protein